jgi:hypothetical protein
MTATPSPKNGPCDIHSRPLKPLKRPVVGRTHRDEVVMSCTILTGCHPVSLSPAGAPAQSNDRPSSAFPLENGLTRVLVPSDPLGSQPAFAWGKVGTPIRFITNRPSLFPASCACLRIGSPYGSLSLYPGTRTGLPRSVSLPSCVG